MDIPVLFSINLGNFGSTGSIMKNISLVAQKYGFASYMAYPDRRGTVSCNDDIVIMSEFMKKLNEKLAYYTGYNGCFAVLATIKLLFSINKLRPDIIHLHNLHNSYINLPLLFKYIKKHNIPVVWTLHDCWAFTGQCPHFTMVKCDKWKTGCHDCPSYREYPQSRIDRTKTMWRLKKKWFTGVENLTIVTPSQWLADLVKQSFLKDYPVKVINNGIDLSVFKPTESDFRQRYAIGEKKIILGVAFGWGVRKGLDVFIKLAEILDEDKFQIVLVGTDETVDKMLPENIISIHRTQNQNELVKIYTAADVFVNPTREDNYPTVNMEAIACGTPVITFRTGGSPEALDESTGKVIVADDFYALQRELENMVTRKSDIYYSCIDKAKSYDQNIKFIEYINLYNFLLGI